MFFCVCFVLLGVIILRSRLSWFDLSSDYLAFERSKESPELNIASPLEAAFLDQHEALWPETFHPNNPFKAARIPSFYTSLKKLDLLGNSNSFNLSLREIEKARVWSVLMAAGQIEELKNLLSKPTNVQISEDKDCSLIKREQWFRSVQLWSDLESAFNQYLALCAPHSVHGLWFEFNKVLLSGDVEKLKESGLQFQLNMNDYPGKWSRWFALEAYQLSHVLAVRSTEHKQ